jgi:RNA-splicing ligase RtcB
MKGKYSEAKIMIDDVETECLSQIQYFLNHEAFTNPIAIMPDTHQGKGSVIGFTMPMTEKVVPNVVGVDIGCSMLSFNIGKTLPMDLEHFDHKIRHRVPFGVDVHESSSRDVFHMEKEFPWKETTKQSLKFALAYGIRFGEIPMRSPLYDMKWFVDKCEKIGGNLRRHINSVGTVGSGNHFLETGIDSSGYIWITIHTGSRNFGKRICDYWQAKAKKNLSKSKINYKEEVERIRKEFGESKIKEKLDEIKENNKPGIDMKGCEYLEGEDAMGYLYDMIFAQMYSHVNKQHIKRIILDILKLDPIDEIETIHNFIDFDDFIIRKGAIRSYEGERMIIPFNMRDGILICEGKSNPEWNFSAPHGAGRVLSRGRAKRELSLETFVAQMKGIYSTSVGRDTLDEAPGAYKDSKVIEDAIGPTATIINRIKPIHNMKDSKGVSDD